MSFYFFFCLFFCLKLSMILNLKHVYGNVSMPEYWVLAHYFQLTFSVRDATIAILLTRNLKLRFSNLPSVAQPHK